MSFNPGDVVIHGAMLSGSIGSVDISRRLMEFSVYEDIKKPYTSIVATVMDSADLLNKNVGLDGTNKFTLAFSQPGQEPYEGEWILTSIEKSGSNQNQRVVYYQMTGYSPHMIKSGLPKVQKAYRYVTYTDVIGDLVNSFLSPNKALLIRAPARNMVGDQKMPFNINGLQVFKAIRMSMLKAASSKDVSSAYVLFENNKNLVLDTLENLLSNAGNGPTYYQRPLGRNFLEDVARQQFTILNYREDSRVDQTTQVQDRTQDVRSVDLFSQKFNSSVFGTGNNPASYISIPYNMMRLPTFAQNFLPARKRIAGQFDTQSLTIQVPLNPALTVGSGFNAEILAPAGDTSDIELATIAGSFLSVETVHTVKLTQTKMAGTTTTRGVSPSSVNT